MPRSLMGRAILFDFNGVIIDDEPQHCEALVAALAEYDIRLDRETYYRDYLGFDDRECFRFTFAQHGRPTDPQAVAEAIERKAIHYADAIRNSMTLVPGALEFVRAAAGEGLALAVVSGALRREIELVLKTAGLRRHFAVLIAAEDVSACKPDPQGFTRAREALGLPPDSCVVLEDSLPGLAAARAAGLRCAALTTSHPADALALADAVWPDLIGRTPAELPWADVAA
jgi:HAD superfamily hydrolase (TIGR01509 family)